MLTVEAFAREGGIEVLAANCDCDHRAWSAPEPRETHSLVLVRRGRFRRRLRGMSLDVDRTVSYLTTPGDEEEFSHPAGGDACTAVEIQPDLWPRLAPGAVSPADGIYVDAALELAHRRLLAEAVVGDVRYGVVEELVKLLARALTTADRGRRPSVSRARDRAHVAAAREALLADEPSAGDLLGLADAVGASPYRLSRAFSRELGVSVTRYRNRVRISRAIERIQEGHRDLAGLAADLGFSDQAHLTRTMRQHVERTPTEVRTLLAPPRLQSAW